MKLAVVSHKLCWRSPGAPDFYQTDGGFPLQIAAISELFDETKVVVPCEILQNEQGVSPLVGRNLRVRPLSVPKGKDLRRKLDFPFWLAKNGWIIWREIKKADAVHAPVPGDVGTIGMLLALLLKKPLFVRHCGNWFVQRTAAEHFWKWTMERFAGGRNVMLATGGSDAAPSANNADIKWIFSTSLNRAEISSAAARKFPADGKFKLIIACRQEKEKGAGIVIESLPKILMSFPNARLDVVGDGPFLEQLKARAKNLRLKDKIVFHGKVTHSRVIELMKQAHVFCFPTSASEGFPKVVLEALACGLPVVTTRVSVLPHLIGENENGGILLNEATADELAGAVGKICADAEFYNRMSEAAIAAAREYSLENWRDFIGETLRQSWQVASLSSV
jgi:glycosyltransferase involved in cell wall biosynthesis